MIPELLGKMLQGFMIHVLLLLVLQHYNEVSFQKKIQPKKKMSIEMDLFRATNKSGAPWVFIVSFVYQLVDLCLLKRTWGKEESLCHSIPCLFWWSEWYLFAQSHLYFAVIPSTNYGLNSIRSLRDFQWYPLLNHR